MKWVNSIMSILNEEYSDFKKFFVSEGNMKDEFKVGMELEVIITFRDSKYSNLTFMTGDVLKLTDKCHDHFHILLNTTGRGRGSEYKVSFDKLKNNCRIHDKSKYKKFVNYIPEENCKHGTFTFCCGECHK